MEENAKEIHIHIHIKQLVGEVKTCNCCKQSSEKLEKALGELLVKVIKNAGDIIATNQE